MHLFALGAVSPWLTMLDPVKYGRYVDTVQNLDITTIAACHSPVIEGDYIERAFARVRRVPDARRAAAARPVGPRPDHRRDVTTTELKPVARPISLTKIRDMEETMVDQVRRFNRTVTQQVGALRDHYLAL